MGKLIDINRLDTFLSDLRSHDLKDLSDDISDLTAAIGTKAVCEVVKTGSLTSISYSEVSAYKFIVLYGYKENINSPNQACFCLIPDQINDGTANVQIVSRSGSDGWGYGIVVQKTGGNLYWWTDIKYSDNDRFLVTKIVGVK